MSVLYKMEKPEELRFRLSINYNESFPPIELKKLKVEDTPKSCCELENSLEEYLSDSSSLKSESELPPLTFFSRPDMAWLCCKPPADKNKESFLGLIEEDVLRNGDAMDLTVWYTGVLDNEHSSGTPIEAPHGSWSRCALSYVSDPPPLNPGGECIAPRSGPWKVDWVDLRSLQSSFCIPTPAAAALFLRSLLGSQHTSSPWVEDEESSRGSPLSNSDCVIVALPCRAPKELLYFRVSDASPSWSLYSVGCMTFPLVTEQAPLPWQKGAPSDLRTDILVYRRLSLRNALSSLHPLSKRKAPKGCLWQTRVVPLEGTVPEHYEYDLVASPYINPIEEFPQLKLLSTPENLSIISNEAKKIPQWTAWPERQHYQVKRSSSGEDDDGQAPWVVFPLCYTFPANDVSQRKWVSLTTALVPKTVSLLKECLGDSLRTALFSRLEPEAVLEAHTGWEDLANYVYRVHLPLFVPKCGLCGTWVDGCVETHEVGRYQAFDDSKTHRAFNYSAEERVVLILDVARPSDLPLGTATGGHSDELDKFIEQMGGAS